MGNCGPPLGFLVSPIKGFKNELKCKHEGSFISIKRKSSGHTSTESQQLPGGVSGGEKEKSCVEAGTVGHR